MNTFRVALLCAVSSAYQFIDKIQDEFIARTDRSNEENNGHPLLRQTLNYGWDTEKVSANG